MVKSGGGKERGNVVIDKESIKRRYLGSYVTVVDCNSEETAEHSSDYLRDLWTDLKSS